MIDYFIGKKIVKPVDLFRFLSACDKDFYPSLGSRVNIKQYAEKLYENAVLITAKDTTTKLIVGLTAFYANNYIEKVAFLTNINVDKEYANKGIGKEMLKRSFDYLKEIYFKQISLDVYEENIKAIKLYKKLNYRLIEKNGIYLRMTKQL